MELELKVDHPAELEAAPSCTASSIPEGIAPEDEETDQHHSGIRGMTVAFQVLFWSMFGPRYCAIYMLSSNQGKTVGVIFMYDSTRAGIWDVTASVRSVLLLMSVDGLLH